MGLPSQEVFVDLRVEIYPYEQWLGHLRMWRRVWYNELRDAYGTDRQMLSRISRNELCGVMLDDPGWAKGDGDDRTQSGAG